MIKLINHEGLKLWNDRFAKFNDAVLKSVSVNFTSVSPVFEMVLEAQDQESSTGWSLVTIRLSKVTSLRFCDGPRSSYQVLSNGLHTLLEGETFALELGDFIDDPESLSELMVSPCHVVGEILEWDAQRWPNA
ncbi:MAG: hypothetical protein EA353_12810 [Puniceicoccaceae bacterium]|nr:MAG: hypothetical protein EA353_12810 [Puniceicoccaceae bacterium]